MNLADYPRITAIMRGYSYQEAMTVIRVLADFDHRVAVEVTTNNPDYLKIIRDGNRKYGTQLYIGAGTILTTEQAIRVIDNGAQFMLGPIRFSQEIFHVAKKNKVITVPAAMTPTGVYELFEQGADIVKIFPAVTVGIPFFKQLQGPLGKLPLMAVGGVNLKNGKQFLQSGASYLGIGTSMFAAEDIHELNEDGLHHSARQYLNLFKD